MGVGDSVAPMFGVEDGVLVGVAVGGSWVGVEDGDMVAVAVGVGVTTGVGVVAPSIIVKALGRSAVAAEVEFVTAKQYWPAARPARTCAVASCGLSQAVLSNCVQRLISHAFWVMTHNSVINGKVKLAPRIVTAVSCWLVAWFGEIDVMVGEVLLGDATDCMLSR